MSDVPPDPFVANPFAPRPEPPCPHEHSEPMWALVHPNRPAEVGDEVSILDAGKPVGRRCSFCGVGLPLAWGCADCEWVEAPRRLCDPWLQPTLVLARPCQEHA